MTDRSTAHDVRVHGEGDQVIVLSHGIGGHAGHWDGVVERLAPRYRCITFALAGSADADLALYSQARHASLLGFADDLALLVDDLGVRGCTFVGHSMSGMAGALAAIADPGLFDRLVMLNASPRYVDDPDAGYVGGLTAEQAEHVLQAIAADYQAWVAGFAPQSMGPGNDPEFGNEFMQTLLAYDPAVTAAMFRAALHSDFRHELRRLAPPTLVLQTRDDPIVPMETARWIAGTVPHAEFAEVDATGHFPQIVAPGPLADAIEAFVPSEA